MTITTIRGAYVSHIHTAVWAVVKKNGRKRHLAGPIIVPLKVAVAVDASLADITNPKWLCLRQLISLQIGTRNAISLAKQM